eukprot:TRINITY_DN9301_c0_g1_i12.p1 TRINITY_DN9301_c0_g1~~TRINITY_DN9301_c0_g1_i12.p1  ORF type:complete len:328 (+),score=62.95 TRINITY_DN9301_c0_g1_i12:2238-3221(+)
MDIPELKSDQNDGSSDEEDDSLISLMTRFIAFPSVSCDATRRKDCWDTAKWLRFTFETYGLSAVLLEGSKGRNPLVFASTATTPGKPSVLFYGHYDVVPVNDEFKWISNPFKLEGRDGFLYGRGATDNKGPIIATLLAFHDLMLSGSVLPINMKFLIEGEEETDSSGLIVCVEQNAELIGKIDLILISNNLWLDDERPCLLYGQRGVMQLTFGVSISRHSLHSGVNGGAVHEPLVIVSHLLSKLVNPQGEILVPGFYDHVRPLTSEEEELYQNIHLDLDSYQQKLRVSCLTTQSKKDLLMKQWRYPSMSFHGITTNTGNNPSSVPGV